MCPRHQKEKQIISLRHKENISFPEARRRVEATNSTTSYADVTKRKVSTQSIEIQTELTWPNGTDAPRFLSAEKPAKPSTKTSTSATQVDNDIPSLRQKILPTPTSSQEDISDTQSVNKFDILASKLKMKMDASTSPPHNRGKGKGKDGGKGGGT